MAFKEQAMDVKEIVKEYLEKNGFDGLCCEECGCGIDDLFACEGCVVDGHETSKCVPAYKTSCVKCGTTMYSECKDVKPICQDCQEDEDERND
jgi:hypothetical protein